VATTDPQGRIEALLITAESAFKKEFLAALKAIEKSIDLGELATLLEQGRFSEAFAIVGTAAARLGAVYAEQFVRAGIDTGNFLTANVEEVIIAFDQTNTRAVNAMRNNQLRLVTNFTEQQRRATQSALVAGIQEGKNPREIARIFRNSIGLTQNQERWVRNYERALRNLDNVALARELRDRRFDPTVRRAIERGEPLTNAQIDKMVARYRQRALKLRSETIARTEGLRVVHEGTDEMYRQAIESGQLQADQLIREWNTAGDERVRDFGTGSPTSHVTMNRQQRLVGEPFASGAGNLTLHPGAFGIGFEDINCRCLVTTRILKLSELTGGASAFA
jgi:uncharacterized protein with gpF-like domain